jgi:hypothetical protein
LIAKDSVHLVLRGGPPLNTVDTVVLFGVRRLDRFDGYRSRKSMVLTGTGLGLIAGVGLWWCAHQTVRPSVDIVPDPNTPGKVVYQSSPMPSIIHQLRNAIPVFAGAGALIGLTIGREHWTPILVPQSVFVRPR